MVFNEIHSKLQAIATISEEDSFIRVIPRKNINTSFFGNIPKNKTLQTNMKVIKSANAIQLSLFN